MTTIPEFEVKRWWVYLLGPIDNIHDEVNLLTVAETIRLRPEHASWSATEMLADLAEAQRLAALKLYWEGDGDAYVIWAPDGSNMLGYNFLWKQSNNGSTYYASRYPAAYQGIAAMEYAVTREMGEYSDWRRRVEAYADRNNPNFWYGPDDPRADRRNAQHADQLDAYADALIGMSYELQAAGEAHASDLTYIAAITLRDFRDLLRVASRQGIEPYELVRRQVHLAEHLGAARLLARGPVKP